LDVDAVSGHAGQGCGPVVGHDGGLDGERVDDSTKSGRSRVVSLDAGTVAILREHRRRQLAERMKAGPRWHPSDLVSTADDGAAIYPDTMTALMRKLIGDHNHRPSPAGARGTRARPCPAGPH
jgi:integrase